VLLFALSLLYPFRCASGKTIFAWTDARIFIFFPFSTFSLIPLPLYVRVTSWGFDSHWRSSWPSHCTPTRTLLRTGARRGSPCAPGRAPPRFQRAGGKTTFAWVDARAGKVGVRNSRRSAGERTQRTTARIGAARSRRTRGG
jgi:hypothetical protein